MSICTKGVTRVLEKAAAGEEINLLMIGNSYCYYYVEELYGLAAAAGIKLRVCNFYYDGCMIEKHYNMWKAGDQLCRYYETFGPEREGTFNVGLEWCLAQRDWDVISLQMGSRTMRKTAEQAVEDTRFYRGELYAYLRERFPEAELFFHQAWTFEIGHKKKDGFEMKDLAQQLAYTANHRAMATAICREDRVRRVNTGDAWELYRAECDQLGMAHNLCARLGKAKGDDPHGGDGTHDGDIGGGQLLNACVWYEVLTGRDCRENPYVPVYERDGVTYHLNETMVRMLKEAAHKAVTEILPTYPENAEK